ncbi:MAG: NAD-dependent epimerase/dehydratase family protein [Deltaproteobacteria bacterium]|nr:NAD-dependent epimerase/dehydratase family protein [Deltaproteobacteria bacterium]
MPRVLITGSAGNLGSRLARAMLREPCALRLMYHRTPLPQDVATASDVEPIRADLADPATLGAAVRGVDTIVHFAGVLFAPRPERFLPTTNTQWFANLVTVALAARVTRIVLISFPHVEGPTTPDRPATGRLDGHPVSVHAQTRLEEERLLFARTAETATTPVSLRIGMVYGPGILMIDAARWLAQRRLLGVWRRPTWIHLIATEDFLRATIAAALRPAVNGIYHLGDEAPTTLQEFLDAACDRWGTARPWRLPGALIRCAAALCEMGAWLFRCRAPLTRDFITIGQVSYCGDTSRFRRDLVPVLTHRTYHAGLRAQWPAE